jgi:sugar phosphate isomerase/epimerase
MAQHTRREFLYAAGIAGAGAALGLTATSPIRQVAAKSTMRIGLVTYLWGKDFDLPTLMDVCEKSGILGVELRTQHAHGVEPSLSKAERAEVRKRFEDSPVELLGYGSNAQYHEAKPELVGKNIELTKEYIRLMHDCGGSGVKVKPNRVVPGSRQKETIERIGTALHEVGAYGADFGQQIRVEVHGSGSSELPVMKAIMEATNHPNVKVCWNSNAEDLHGEGLEYNFNLVKEYFGDTVHVREFNVGDYPYQQLMDLFKGMDYSGWIFMEARTDPADKVKALIEQREIFTRMTGNG